MKLGPKFARAILAGKAPALTDEPKLEQGQVVDLHRYAPFEIEAQRVWITVGRWMKAGRWAYLLHDHRPRHLGRQTGYTDRSSRAIGSGDRSESGNLWDEPENIDDRDHSRIHREAGAKTAWSSTQQQLRTEKIRHERRLEDARVTGKRGTVRAIERQIVRLDARLDDAA